MPKRLPTPKDLRNEQRVRAYEIAAAINDDLLGGCLKYETFWEIVERLERALRGEIPYAPTRGAH